MSKFKKIPIEQYDFLENEKEVALDEPEEKDSSRVRDFLWMKTRDWGCVTTREEYEKVRDRIVESSRKGKLWSFDYETTGLDIKVAEIVGVSFSDEVGWARYIPLGHTHAGFLRRHSNFSIDELWEWLRPLLEDESVKKSAYNLQYEWAITYRYGVKIKGGQDGMGLVYLDNTNEKKKGLKESCYRYFGLDMYTLEDLFPGARKGKVAIVFGSLDPTAEVVVHYTCGDSDVNLMIHKNFEDVVTRDRGIIFRMENKLATIFPKMELAGVRVDADYLRAYSSELDKKLPEMLKKMHEVAGAEFNPDSRKQVADLFFGKLGLPILGRTPKGAPATSLKVLEKLKSEHPLVGAYCDYLSLRTLKSNFLDMLPEHVDPKTGRVHCDFMSLHIPTGRVQTKNPNLMNMPKTFEESEFNVRDCFVAEEGYTFLDMDFSQVELRVCASIARIPEWMKTFNRGEDLHTLTAAAIFGVPRHMVTKTQRRAAKEFNFGIIYGMSAPSLKKKLEQSIGVVYTLQEAKRYHRNFHDNIPRLREWSKEVYEFAEKYGYVLTWYGRRRPIPWIRSSDRGDRGFGERSAVNTIIQGCLQYESRILTEKGLIRIGDLHSGKVSALKVWDGYDWCTYKVWSRGEAQLADVYCKDGSVLRCDDRHELFYHPGTGRPVKYRSVHNLSDLRLAKVRSRNSSAVDCGELPAPFYRRDFKVDTEIEWEFWSYWFGVFLLCGELVEGGALFNIPRNKINEIDYLVSSFSQRNLVVTKFTDVKRAVENICVHSMELRSLLITLGAKVVLGNQLEVAYLSDILFSATRSMRRSFLEGLSVLSGTETTIEVKENVELLRDIMMLAEITGFKGRVAEKEGGWLLHYRVSIFYVLGGDDRYCGSYFERLDLKGVKAETYTLSVDSERQRFFSDGFLSKNTAADMMKMAIIRCHDEIESNSLPVRMLLTVHDQLLFEVKEDKVDEIAPRLKEKMTVQPKGFVVIDTDVDYGKRWGSCQKWKGVDSKKVRNKITLKLAQGFSVEELTLLRDTLRNNVGSYPVVIVFQGRTIDAKLNSSEVGVSSVMSIFQGRVEDVE